MREEIVVVKRTCDLCGYEMHNADDNEDIDLEDNSHHWLTVKTKWFDEYPKVYLKIVDIEVEVSGGPHKGVKQCCSSCLHKLLGTDDGN